MASSVVREKTPDQVRGEAPVFQKAGPTGALPGVRGGGRTVLLIVDGGNSISPFFSAEVEMGIDQGVRKPFAMKLLTHPYRPEALVEPFRHVGLGEALLAQQAAARQVFDHGQGRSLSMAPAFKLAYQLQAAVVAGR